MKIISKKMIRQLRMKNQLKNEVKLMMLTNHENIVKYETHFEDKEYIFLVLDLAEEGKNPSIFTSKYKIVLT